MNCFTDFFGELSDYCQDFVSKTRKKIGSTDCGVGPEEFGLSYYPDFDKIILDSVGLPPIEIMIFLESTPCSLKNSTARCVG